MGRLGMALIAAAVGTVMYWMVTTQGAGLRVSTAGVVLIAGGVGLVGSMIVLAAARRPAAGSRQDQRHVVVPKIGRRRSTRGAIGRPVASRDRASHV